MRPILTKRAGFFPNMIYICHIIVFMIRSVAGVAVVEYSTNPMSSYIDRESDMNNVVLHNGGDSDQSA